MRLLIAYGVVDAMSIDGRRGDMIYFVGLLLWGVALSVCDVEVAASLYSGA